ncbi:MAG: ferritin-like domain-containing protein [Acidobacteria bacterium]|nr:MAG: ferritin-like domain-containing protein [Acidobacteriota bacterium]
MAKIDSLEPLMIEELRDILDAEKQVTKALPKMARAASSEQLRAAFEEHQQQTSGQIQRLNQVFDEIGERPRGKTCEAMKSLIEEGQQMMEETEPGPTRDALLIAAAQKVEHYEMAAYGTARTFASLLGHREAARLLEQTLEQEKETDARLTNIAESVSNPQAAGRPAERVRGSSRGSASERSGSSGRSAAKKSPVRGRNAGRAKKSR